MLILLVVIAALGLGNNSPATPTVTEPSFDGRVTNPEDTHMETGLFSDPDPGDTHAASDWEIWTISPSQRVWAALGVVGGSRVHIHLGDGVFQGSHAGRSSLISGTNYQLRVRHKDSSGDPATQWSPYATRLFTTGSLSTVFPMELDDIVDSPAPTWRDTTGVSAVLPSGATLRVESATGQALLTLTGTGSSNQIVNPSALPAHVPVRVRVTAAAQALTLPETDLDFTDHEGVDRVILLPPINTLAGQSSYFWVAANGSTFIGQAAQTTPDFSILARGAAVPWETFEPGYKVEIVATGFRLPVNIAFVPNPGAAPNAPMFYVSELYGAIKVVRRNGTVGTYVQGLLNFTPSGLFPGSGECGLTGLVVHPVTGDVYAAMLYAPPQPHDDYFPKVVRFQSVDGGQTAATQTIIRDMVNEWQGQSHQISNLTFGPDGKLYVHMGDGFDYTTAQDLESYRGKILRMNTDGTAPPDNPFYNAGNGITARDYVWAYGLRNPFGGAWRAADGKHYQVENGPGIDRLAKVNAGQNFLWNGTDASMQNFAIYNWNPASGPVNMAITQLSTFGGSGFPASKMDHVFVTESGSTWGTGPNLAKRISEFVLDANGNLISGPSSFVQYNGTGKASAAGLAAGPDGLYFTDLYKDLDYTSPTDAGANVLRVRFVGAASFSANITSGPAPLAVQFTDQSTVVNPTSWLWTFGDGTSSTQQHPTKVYSQDGIYTVRLAVTGSSGTAAFQRTNYIKVGNIAKVAIIGGSLPAWNADEAVGDMLAARGLEVTYFDDEPANRPSAAQLAASHDLVVVSSTVASANIGGEFRTANVPLMFWESLLLRSDREGLATSGTVSGGQGAISIVNTTHPITQGFAAGNLTVFQPGANMTVGIGPFATGATVLARRGASTDAALLIAEQGAALLSGYVAPARRAFVFLEDSSFMSATSEARDILLRAACWAGSFGPAFTDQPDPVTVAAGQGASFSVSLVGAGPMSYQWRRNGVPLSNGGAVSGATSPTLVISAASAANTGSYDVVVAAPCGTVTSTAANLSVSCYANCDGSTTAPVLTANDFSCFLVKYNAQDPYANCDGSTMFPVLNANDFLCFIGAYAAGCP